MAAHVKKQELHRIHLEQDEDDFFKALMGPQGKDAFVEKHGHI